jgi:hypothetical protein
MTNKHEDVEVAPDVTFNGLWYTVTTPGGMTWTYDDEDLDAAYAKESLWAWSRWLDFIESRNAS